MKDKFNAGCCGHPPSCEQSGRCKAREDYTNRKEVGKLTFDDHCLEQMTPEQWDRIKKASRKRTKRERKREGGRELEPYPHN